MNEKTKTLLALIECHEMFERMAKTTLMIEVSKGQYAKASDLYPILVDIKKELGEK
jgi:hypothetical protein